MSRFSFDENGIPRLSTNDIETRAEEVIEFFGSESLQRPCQTPIMDFVQETSRKYNLAIDFERDLGKSQQGHKILGMFCFQPRKILVDKSLNGDIRLHFILGHEFGHLVLHRDLVVKKKGYSDVDITDTVRDFVTGRKILLKPRDWLEWQANRFSSAILMPRATLPYALSSVQKSLEINHNLGRVFLERSLYSQRDFDKTLMGLQLIYQVNKRSLEFRLKELGLLIDQRNRDTKHISELLKEN